MLRRFFLVPVLLVTAAACGGQIDPTATKKTTTGQTNGDEDDIAKSRGGASGKTDVGGSTGSSGGAGCKGTATPIKQDFEQGLGTSFEYSSPSSYEIEYERPIDDFQSLRVKSGATVFMTRSVTSACTAQVTFTIMASAETIKSGMLLLHVEAGSRTISLSMFPGNGTLGLLETIKIGPASGGGGGGDPLFSAPILPEVPTTIQLGVNLDTEELKLTMSTSLSSRPPELYEAKLMGSFGTEMVPPAITAISIGNGPNGISSSTGSYVLDSIAID